MPAALEKVPLNVGAGGHDAAVDNVPDGQGGAGTVDAQIIKLLCGADGANDGVPERAAGKGYPVSVQDIPAAATASAPARTVTGAAAQILAVNANRKQFLVQNVGTNVVFCTLGSVNPTASVYHFSLKGGTLADDGTGGSFISDTWTGAVRAFSALAGAVVVTELSA